MSLSAPMRTLFFRGVDVTEFIAAYVTFSSCNGTDLLAEDVIETFTYYLSETIRQTITTMNAYLGYDRVQLNKEMKDAFQQADSWVYIYTRSYLERLCWDLLERGNIGWKVYILAYDNISSNMTNKRASAEYSQVAMLHGFLPTDVRAKAVMKLEPNPRKP